MRFKYYLRGIGLGILLTTILLTVSFHIKGSSISDAEVIERAQGLGMIMPSEEQNSDADEPEDTQTTESENHKEQSLTPDADKQTDESQMEESELPSVPDADENTGDTADYYTVTVASGAVCRDIAEELMQLGLVEDSEDFRLYMDQNGYDNMIRVGEFQIPRDASYEEIAQILTRSAQN